MNERYAKCIPFDKNVKGRIGGNPPNMFITPWEHFNGYSEWLFSILFELEKRVKLSAYPDQARLFGYLSERLINVYCIKNHLRIKYIPVIMPLDEEFHNPSNLHYSYRRLKNNLIYKFT